MEFKNIMLCGCGVLGSQIAWQIASCGFNVKVYEINKEGESRCMRFHRQYAEAFKTVQPLKNIKYTDDIEDAVLHADLIIESVSEDLSMKEELYRQISLYADKNSIIVTNSSTIKPSQLSGFIKYPSRFCAMHFANPVWEAGIAEIMGHSQTDKDVFERVARFAEEIKLIPIKIYKEQRGYVLNALLIPWLAAAQHLYFTGVADYRDIDRVWRASTKSKIGPFGIMDIIGLKTIYDINLIDYKKTGKKELLERAETIKKEFIDKGRLGISAGEGFYKYLKDKSE